MRVNHYGDWEEAYRSIKCKTAPIMVKDKDGKDVEDKRRTNVAMPTQSVIVRRGVARLTAQPPMLNYRAPSNQDPNPELIAAAQQAMAQGQPMPTGLALADRLTSMSLMQYDRSGEARQTRKLVHQAKTFGIAVSKCFWDKVCQSRQFRRSTFQIDRQTMMSLSGAPFDEINQAVNEQSNQLSPDEIQSAVSQLGPEYTDPQELTKYEGPVVKVPFIGDVGWEPGVDDINMSDYFYEQQTWTDLDLRKEAAKTYEHPEFGTIQKLDQAACKELVAMDSRLPQDKQDDFKRRLRDVIAKTTPDRDKRLLKGKKFDITEYHELDENGVMGIIYIGNDKIVLNAKDPDGNPIPWIYPWDLGGRYIYTPYVPWPDILTAVGDTGPILMRYLHDLHNKTVGLRHDLVVASLKKTLLVQHGMDIPDEAVERALMRVLEVKNPNGLVWMPDPQIPQAAWESEGQILRMEALVEPSLNTVDTGSESNPMAGKLATTAIINQKTNDVLFNDEMNNLLLYHKELAEKKLQMMQEVQSEPLKVPGQYSRSEALSQIFGKTAAITIDPMEFQEDIEIEPVAMSILSVEDDIKRDAAERLYAAASADPVTFNKPYIAQMWAATIPGVDVQKVTPGTPANPLQKLAGNISIPLDKLPSDLQSQFLQMMGLQPSQITPINDHLETVKKVSEAADAADNIAKPAEADLPPEPTPHGMAKEKKPAA